MTLLELIKAACKSKGVPEAHAERIQKTFKIDKAEGLETYVEIYRENILPAIEEAEKNGKELAESAAIKAYEEKYKLKDGKPLEGSEGEGKEKENEIMKGVSPEIKAYLETMRKNMEDLSRKIDDTVSKSAANMKRDSVRAALVKAELPESWLGRIDLDGDVSVEDQIKTLGEEYSNIKQKAIDDAVARGEYSPGAAKLPERSEEDWTSLMNQDISDNSNPGVVNLGIE